MNNYSYIPEDPELHWKIKLHYRKAARRDKKYILKQFRSDLHLDKAEETNVSYLLPKSYPIITKEIEFLYDIGEKIESRMKRKFLEVQERIRADLETKNKEYGLIKERRIAEKTDLDLLKNQLSSIKKPSDRIALQSQVAKAKTKLDNTDLTIVHYESDLKNMDKTYVKNQEEWDKQVRLTNKTVKIAIDQYIELATSRIKKQYGFTNFTYFEKSQKNDKKDNK